MTTVGTFYIQLWPIYPWPLGCLAYSGLHDPNELSEGCEKLHFQVSWESQGLDQCHP